MRYKNFLILFQLQFSNIFLIKKFNFYNILQVLQFLVDITPYTYIILPKSPSTSLLNSQSFLRGFKNFK